MNEEKNPGTETQENNTAAQDTARAFAELESRIAELESMCRKSEKDADTYRSLYKYSENEKSRLEDKLDMFYKLMSFVDAVMKAQGAS